MEMSKIMYFILSQADNEFQLKSETRLQSLILYRIKQHINIVTTQDIYLRGVSDILVINPTGQS